MDSSQTNLILRNMSKLIKNTSCTKVFLSKFVEKEILSLEDVEEIEAVNRGRYDIAYKFYHLVITRQNSFDLLITALRDTNQNSALKILLDDDSVQPSSSSNIPSETASEFSNPRRFKDVPKFLKKFQKDKQKTLLIISSEDTKVTCDRIMETVKNCKTFQNITDLGMHETSSITHIICVYNCEDKLEESLMLLAKLKMKIVLVTTKFIKVDAHESDVIKKIIRQPNVIIMHECMSWDELNLDFKLEVCQRIEAHLNNQMLREDTLQALHDIDSSTLLQLIGGKTPSLFKDNIPEIIPYYVPRSLARRNLVGNQIFTIVSKDIFIFQGIQRQTLSQFTQTREFISSSELIDGYQLYSEFVILDRSDHFDKIVRYFDNKSVHLLDYNGSNFVWKKTIRKIDDIQFCLLPHQTLCTESEFISELIDLRNFDISPICIADTPGMGKSVLLASIARNLQQKTTDGLVGFVVISELIANIKSKINLSQKDNPEEHPSRETQSEKHFTVQEIISILSYNNIDKVFLQKNKLYLKELLLDGFDEIDIENEELAYKVFKTIQFEFPNARLWITGRPHTLQNLERTFTVLGFNMVPFREEDQVNFLTSFWRKDNTLINSDKIQIFAKNCLTAIKSTLNTKEQDIAGIPLQCYMIGEVFREEACMYCETQDDHFVESQFNLGIKHVVELYDKLVEKKFSSFFDRYKAPPSVTVSFFRNFLATYLSKGISEFFYGRLEEPVTTQHLKGQHIYRAVQLVFPSLQNKLKAQLDFKNVTNQHLVDCGLMESKDTKGAILFVHRTFAEYFLASYFLDYLENGSDNNTLNWIIDSFFQTREVDVRFLKNIKVKSFEFRNYVVCYFIDALLGQKEQLNVSHLKPISNTWIYNIHQIFLACVFGNFPNIFSAFFKNKKFQKLFGRYFLLKLVSITVYRGHINLLKLFRKYNIVDMNELTGLSLNDYTIFHFAVLGGDYNMVYHLGENENFRNLIINNLNLFKDLIPICIIGTTRLSDTQLNEREQVFDYIIGINKNLSMCTHCEDQVIFLRDDVHKIFLEKLFSLVLMDKTAIEYYFQTTTKLLNVRKRLIYADTSFRNTNFSIPYLLYATWETYSYSETDALKQRLGDDMFYFLLSCKFYKLESKKSTFEAILQAKKDINWAIWLLKYAEIGYEDIIKSFKYLYGNFDTDDVLKLLKYVNPKIRSSNGDTLLQILVKLCYIFNENLSLAAVAKFFVDVGVGINKLNKRRDTVLHTLAKIQYAVNSNLTVKLFVDLGANVNAQDVFGNSPLHYAVEGLNKYPGNIRNIFSDLVENGAQLYNVNDKLVTPLFLCGELVDINDRWYCLLTFITKGNHDIERGYLNKTTVQHMLMDRLTSRGSATRKTISSVDSLGHAGCKLGAPERNNCAHVETQHQIASQPIPLMFLMFSSLPWKSSSKTDERLGDFDHLPSTSYLRRPRNFSNLSNIQHMFSQHNNAEIKNQTLFSLHNVCKHLKTENCFKVLQIKEYTEETPLRQALRKGNFFLTV